MSGLRKAATLRQGGAWPTRHRSTPRARRLRDRSALRAVHRLRPQHAGDRPLGRHVAQGACIMARWRNGAAPPACPTTLSRTTSATNRMPPDEGHGVIRFLLIALMVAGTAGTVMAYGDPHRLAQARHLFTELLIRARGPQPRVVEIPRTASGEFTLSASINGVNAPMVVDTGATSVVLTYETAKAAGLPLEMLDYGVPVETVNGRARAARLTLDASAIGGLVERSCRAVVPRGPDDDQPARHEFFPSTAGNWRCARTGSGCTAIRDRDWLARSGRGRRLVAHSRARPANTSKPAPGFTSLLPNTRRKAARPHAMKRPDHIDVMACSRRAPARCARYTLHRQHAAFRSACGGRLAEYLRIDRKQPPRL